MNVQHLESLNDKIAELTRRARARDGARHGAQRADEIVLVDVTPEALLERLRAGKVYPAERIDTALNNFFKIENLNALRETALRQVAENVEARRVEVDEPLGTREERVTAGVPQAVGERLLALVEPCPGAQRLIRRAWRSAQRLGAPLDLLWVAPPGGAMPDGETASERCTRCASSHRCSARRCSSRRATTSPTTAARVAGERGTTYILLGASRPARGLARLREPLPDAARAAGARRRRPHRRRPHADARTERTERMIVVLLAVVIVAALVGRSRGRPLAMPRSKRRQRDGRPDAVAAHPAAVHRHHDLAPGV